MSFITGTSTELLYVSTSAGTAKASFTSEAQINDTSGMGVQCHLPPDFWLPAPGQIGRAITIIAEGILSSTGTPTYTWSIRSGAAGNTSSAILLGTAAMTTTSGASNQYWKLEGTVVLTSIGAAGTNSTVRGLGTISSPGLAASGSPAYGGAASPGTVATLDTSITNYINVNVACSASSASNTITLHQLRVMGLN